MIKVITGRPGTGKSYYGTKLAVEEMKKGRMIFSNIKINFNHNGRTYTNYKLTKDMITTIKFPQDSILIVDEAGFWFNSREFKNFDLEDFKFFSQHRHLNIDIILIVQNLSRIDITLRELAHEIIYCSSFLKIWFRHHVAYGLEEYTNDEFTFKRMIRLKKYYAQAYNTNQCLEDFNNRLEKYTLYDYDEQNQLSTVDFIKGIFKSKNDKSNIDNYTRELEDENKKLKAIITQLKDKVG